MTTLIAVYDSSGKCRGRCDASCYTAIHDTCTCICGGMNHGKGLEKAAADTIEFIDDWLEAYKLKVDFSEVETPGLYTTKTRTATKIARHMNAYYGGNVIRDVERVGRTWQVTDGADFLETFKSFREVKSRYPLAQKVVV